MLCIGLSWRGPQTAYDAYETALRRRANALGLAVEIQWLAGRERRTLTSLLPELDGVVFTGGADVSPARYGQTDRNGLCRTDEERDAIEFKMLEHFAARPRPTLAICRGAQIHNVFHGGSLIQDLGPLTSAHKRTGNGNEEHAIHIEAGTRLAAIARSSVGTVNSSHHQAVDRLAAPFRPSATAPDRTLEAYEYTDPDAHPFFLAVQWHPELMEPGSTLSDAVLDAFIQASMG